MEPRSGCRLAIPRLSFLQSVGSPHFIPATLQGTDPFFPKTSLYECQPKIQDNTKGNKQMKCRTFIATNLAPAALAMGSIARAAGADDNEDGD
jgi:hypothetical protein